MTKLYYTSTSCGAASFIAAVAAGLKISVQDGYVFSSALSYVTSLV